VVIDGTFYDAIKVKRLPEIEAAFYQTCRHLIMTAS